MGRRYIRRVYTDRYGRVHDELVDTRTGKAVPVPVEMKVNDVLRSKYGISREELQRIVATSKSQPEAIAKLRKRLHGSTKYDPKYFEVERLLNQLYDAKEHAYIPGVKDKAEKALRSLVPGAKAEVEQNTGIKTVPKPQPKPSTVVREVTATSTAVEVHEPEKKSRFGVTAVLGVVAAFLILKKVLRW
ncbi:hypothetical protein [Thermococcus aciditolerans]|uniref:Uncharacterized protein n=1 Tax=Thermococcus aciditolerans TaxID=2598455 RepID=A0A5C0SKE3_9EURY|nr:hypothetical protein [Thermococcus aciditolerans]QEK14750.1 hypothetical protein FPV09_06180 [Thermococcus aciditolerans]